MRSSDKLEQVLYVLCAVIIIAFVVLFAIAWVNSKDQMCHDIGNKVYGHWLSWFQCLAL